jgi:hypothetical protein
MFCVPALIFGCIEGVRSRFHILRARTRFRRYRGCLVPFICFPRPNSFSAVPRASGLVSMFCVPALFFGGTEGVGSHYHVLSSQTHFQRYRGRRVPFSCFALSDSFSAAPRASGPVFMFCVLALVFSCTEGVGSRFNVLHSRTHFRRYHVNSHFNVLRAILVSDDTEGVGSSIHVLRSRTRFRRFRGRRVSFSCFASPHSFSAVPRASGPVFMFCNPGLVFDGTEGVCPVFIFCTPGLIFGVTKGVGSRFHVLCVGTHIRRYRGRQVPF